MPARERLMEDFIKGYPVRFHYALEREREACAHFCQRLLQAGLSYSAAYDTQLHIVFIYRPK